MVEKFQDSEPAPGHVKEPEMGKNSKK